MTQLLTRFRASCSRLWARVAFWREPLLLPDVEVDPVEVEPDPRDIGLLNSYHIRGLLDRLPNYFEDLRALRKVDETAYRLFSTLGGTLSSGDGLLRAVLIPPEVIASPPHVRCLFLSADGDSDNMAPLIYMMRMAGGQLVVTAGGCVALPPGLCYRVVMVFRDHRKPPIAEEWFIHIDGHGTVHILPEVVREWQYLPKTKHARRHGSNSFTRKTIRTEPALLALSAKEKNTTIAAHAQTICALTLSASRPKDCVLVRASLGHEAAAWTIDRNDAKRFFRQRETGSAADGKRKRVLHYVAPFTRSNGQEVREHYRGERKFDWNGYRIEVSGLGFHHADMFDADMSQYDADTTNQPGMISLRKAVKAVRRRYSKPVFLR